MADNLKPPAGAVPPPAAGAKVQPKKETVRISLPPKPAAKETVRLELPPRTPAAAAPAAPPPKPAAPAAPAAASAAPVAAKQTVRLSLPPKPSAAKETVRLELPPKPAAGAAKPGAAPGGKEIKLVVPQVDEAAASAKIPEVTEDMPTMDSSQAQPAAAGKPAGLKGGPPGGKPAAASAGPAPGKAAAAPASALPDSTPSAMALPAKKALPKAEAATAAVATGGVVVRKAGWPDYLLASIALLTGLAAVGRLFMLIGGE